MKALMPSRYMFVALFLCAPVAAQDIAAVEAAEEDSGIPYEIVITPTISKGDLRELIAGVEEDFYNKFNEINIDVPYL